MPIYTTDEISVEEFTRQFAGDRKPRTMSQRQREDSRWVIDHLSELAQLYPDQWIAMHEKRVVGAAPGVGEALEQAHHKVGEGKELVTIFVEGKVYVF